MSTAPLWQRSSRASGSPRLLAARGQVMAGRAGRHFSRILKLIFRSLRRAWMQSRRARGGKPAVVRGGGLGAAMSAVMGRALAGKADRMLSVEERLTLGPKQHLYVIRCGEQRLLLASAVEGALQWMPLPEEKPAEMENACGNTDVAIRDKEKISPRRAGKQQAQGDGGSRRGSRRTKTERAVREGAR